MKDNHVHYAGMGGRWPNIRTRPPDVVAIGADVHDGRTYFELHNRPYAVGDATIFFSKYIISFNLKSQINYAIMD